MMELQEHHGFRLWLQEVRVDGYAVRGACIQTGTTALIWDTLSHPRNMEAYLPLLSGRRLIIVYSHADYDHIWGTGGLPYERAEIIAEESALARFATDVPGMLEQRRKQEPEVWREVVLVPPKKSFSKITVLDLGNVRLTLHSVPGHTADTIVGYLKEAGLLLAGDAVECPLVEVTRPEHVPEWLALLRTFQAMPGLRRVIPAHGPMGGPEILAETVQYLESLQAGQDCFGGRELSDFYAQLHKENLRRMAVFLRRG
jgi:glyoxylase-like metal-dependent hydrolase (beta-lactamase superfamily II)